MSYYQSTHSLSVAAPAEKIFEVLTNWPLRSQWRRGIGISWEEEGRAFVGQKVTFTVKRKILPHSFTFRVTGLEPPRRIYMEYLGNPLKGRAAIEIVPDEKQCRVDFHWMKVEPEGWGSRLYFALGFGMAAHRKRTMETLRMLKEYFEKPT